MIPRNKVRPAFSFESAPTIVVNGLATETLSKRAAVDRERARARLA